MTARHYFFSLIVCCSALTAHAQECARDYRIAAESPVIDPNSSAGILQQVIAELGCKSVIVDARTSQERRLQLLAAGAIDLMSEASLRPERTVYAHYSKPYRDEVTLLVVRADIGDQGIHHINDVLRLKKRILAPDKSWYGPDVERERESWRERGLLLIYKDPAAGLRDLRLKRADVMLCPDSTCASGSAELNDLMILPFEVHREAVYFIFSKRTITLSDVDRFNQALRQWQAHKQSQKSAY
jgi:polar amino acid transport system substrate-binding protein